MNTTRRRLLLASLAFPALPALDGCAKPLRILDASHTTPEAQALLLASATAHGLEAWSHITDLSVSYSGKWHGLVAKLQPALVDAQFRQSSEERWLLKEGVVAQAHTGPGGHKQVVRHSATHSPGDIRVWFNTQETHDTDPLAAAALVTDAYSLFLQGPVLLAQRWAAERTLVMQKTAPETLKLNGQHYDCDVLRLSLTPGLGLSDNEQMALFIDRQEHLLRRVRFTLNGLESTRGAIAEVDLLEYATQHGIHWPIRFHERLLRPLALSVHDWHLVGLDVNRGLTHGDLDGPEFFGKALAPARPLENR